MKTLILAALMAGSALAQSSTAPTISCTPAVASSSGAAYTFTCTVTQPSLPPPVLITPTITFAPIPSMVMPVAPFTVSATSNSTSPITYNVVSGPATISSNTVTVTGAGTVVIMASQLANSTYTSGTVQTSFTVAPATVTPPTTPVTSANCTIGTTVTDASLNVWTLSGGVVYENGKTAGYSSGVIALVYANGFVYQENNSDLFWEWNPSASGNYEGWLSVPDPTPNNCAVAPPPPPPPPPAVYNVDLTWGAPTVGTPTGYVVYREAKGGTFSVIGSTLPGGTNFTDANVTDGVTYIYQVTASYTTGGASVPSNQFTAAIP
jgi:hypothetical protein